MTVSALLFVFAPTPDNARERVVLEASPGSRRIGLSGISFTTPRLILEALVRGAVSANLR
jgi:hypothetical protein